jgi:purine-binding chemotaxis protein CheW
MNSLHVLFTVEGAEYVLAASDVLQMESFTGATRVPGTPPFVAGLVHIRGAVVPVIDLRLRFGLPSVARTLDTRVVIGRSGERTVGLVVDSAREVVQLDPETFRAPPPVVAQQAHGFVKSIAQFGSRILMLLDLSKIIGEEPIHAES